MRFGMVYSRSVGNFVCMYGWINFNKKEKGIIEISENKEIY